MKTTSVIVLLFVAALASAKCREGYVPTDVEGVCAAKTGGEMNPDWVSDEKPPTDKMPSWQREGVKVIDAPNMASEDERMDREKVEAIAEGKRKAGIK